MSNLVSKAAPDFTADAVMPDGSFKQIKLSDLSGEICGICFFIPLILLLYVPTGNHRFQHKNG